MTDSRVVSLPMNMNQSRRERDCQRVIVKDYGIPMYLGLHEHEKKTTQMVLLSVEIEVVDRTQFWDYDRLISYLEKDLRNARIETQEELCDQIVSFVEDGPSLRRLIVQSKKPDIFKNAKFVSIERCLNYTDSN